MSPSYLAITVGDVNERPLVIPKKNHCCEVNRLLPAVCLSQSGQSICLSLNAWVELFAQPLRVAIPISKIIVSFLIRGSPSRYQSLLESHP